MFSYWNRQTDNRRSRRKLAQRRRQAAARRARHRLLGCEYLEDRRVLAATIVVMPATMPTAMDNDFTRLQNAVGSVTAGDTVDIQGTFDWTETNAAASYAASTANSATADIRGIELPAGVNDVTITSSTNDAHIIGRGDFEDLIFDAFLFADDGPSVGNTNFTLEKLNIDDFENAVMFGWNGTGTFTGTKVRDNTITLGGDDFDLQNIAIYFAVGTGQQVTGNTVSFQGDGTRVVGSGARSFGFQNNTTGGALYDNLLIDDNTFQLLPSSTGVEIMHGIWENGDNHDNSSDIAITDNRFLGRTGVDDFDRALMLTSQTDGLVIGGNTFSDVDNVLFSRNASGGTGLGDEFTFTNNVLTRVGGADGIFLRNVTDDAMPIHVIVNWNSNTTIDTFTGIRGLNELSTQATGSSRPAGAASDLSAVNGIGTVTNAFVNDNWGAPGRFTDPDGIGAGLGPIAFSFNTFDTIQAGVDAVAASGTVNVLAGTYAENVDTSSKAVTLSAQASATDQVTINGDLTLDANDALAVQINGATAGANYDQWIVNGMVTLATAALAGTGTRTANPGDVIVLIKNDSMDAMTGTFAGQPELSIVIINSVSYAITYKYNSEAGTSSDGNDMALIDTELDYGDAPDPLVATPGQYPTLLTSNGAWHTSTGPRLGTQRDSESDGQPNATATGDDVNGSDDEDGVSFSPGLVQGQTGSADVVASVAGLLNAWIDFDNNGSWAEVGEQIATDVMLGAGVNTLTFAVPPGATINVATYARFRFDTGGGLSFIGGAADGEVEDYQVTLRANKADEIGVKRGNDFLQDVNGTGHWEGASDRINTFGNSTGDTPLAGDWDGDGLDEIGVRRGRAFYLDVNGNGVWDGPAGGDLFTKFGIIGDVPVIGDWNDDGIDDIGVQRGNAFYLDASGNGLWGGVPGGDLFFHFGNSGDTPVVGDWDGDGIDQLAIHRSNQFYLDVSGNGSWGVGDAVYTFGNPSDIPLKGDWDGDGRDEVGVKRGNMFYLDVNGNGSWNSTAGDSVHVFGDSSDLPLIGRWRPLGPLTAAGGVATGGTVAEPLTMSALQPIRQQALVLWANTGLNAAQRQSLEAVQFSVAELPGAQLGLSLGGTILLDADAAGYGWFVDPTPEDNSEFSSPETLSPNPQSLDLLTAVLHELGHELGYDHDDDIEAMFETLAAGTRRLLN